MIKNRIAAIDMGTNTILLLIADLDINNHLVRVKEHYALARLGENVDKSNKICENAIARASKILIEIKSICDHYEVERILTVGTSALRDAQNGLQVIKIFNDILNSNVKIIDGDTEAQLSFRGTVQGTKETMLIDIGGGSTELIIGYNNDIKEKVSMQIGAVRITEKFFESQQIPNSSSIAKAREYITNTISQHQLHSNFDEVFAVGGTATTIATSSLGLADTEIDSLDNYVLKSSETKKVLTLLANKTSDEIIRDVKIHPKRADVILAGTLILDAISDYYKIGQISISRRGLRYGVIENYYHKLLTHKEFVW